MNRDTHDLPQLSTPGKNVYYQNVSLVATVINSCPFRNPAL